MRYISAFIKLFICAAIIYLGFLYFTRPEMEITPEAFVNTARDNGFQVVKTYVSGATVAYSAISHDKKFRIDYVAFNSNEQAHGYYTQVMDNVEEKHSQSFARDVRIGKPTAEKQSYSDFDIYYVGIYAKNAVINSICDMHRRDEVNGVINKLFKPVGFDLTKPETFIPKI